MAFYTLYPRAQNGYNKNGASGSRPYLVARRPRQAIFGEGIGMPNGIYIQTEYHGKLIRKIVCNGEERWFIGSDCAVTFLSMAACMAAIDQLA